MARPRAARAASAPAPRERADSLILPGAVLLAILLPFVLYSAVSDEAVRESKLLLVALASAVALLGLSREEDVPVLRRAWLLPLAGLAGLVLVSAARAIAIVDPLTAVALLAPVPLVLAGASRSGSAVAPRALALLGWCGAATGALATLQRFGGVLRMPVTSADARFFATGLVGNPGDAAATLVLPAVLVWHRMTTAGRTREGGLAAAGLLAVLAGVGSTEAIGPLLAIGAGIAVLVLFDLRRRLPAALLTAVLALAATIPTGAAGRAFKKWTQLRSGDVSGAFTQRDIGVAAALQMIRSHPLLGVGPGAYENAFVPARLAAEVRLKRRLVHESDAAHFENAHSEPLDVAAECGLPAALLAGGLGVALLVRLVRRRLAGEESEGQPPADLLVALVAAFGLLSTGSFPLRMPPALAAAAFVTGVALRRAGAVDDRAGGPRRRLGLAVAAGVLALLAGARFAAVWMQARGEMELRSIPIAGEYREQLLAGARQHLSLAARLRPRKASALLELGSASSLSGDATAAWDLTRRSILVGERAETDVALGLLAREKGDEMLAHALFVRGIWILPKALVLVPDEADPTGVAHQVGRLQIDLATGGLPPPLPPIS